MIHVLWIAPHLNHYKARCLNRLAAAGGLAITVVSGRLLENSGHEADPALDSSQQIQLDISKKSFHRNPKTYCSLLRILEKQHYDTVLMPLERKHFPLILFLSLIRWRYGYRLVSYNHPLHRTVNSAWTDLFIKGLYGLFDRIIFYTEQGMLESTARCLIQPGKAFFSNNTLDTKSIWENYTFEVNISSPKRLLFIGRLTRRKRLNLLLEYFREIQIRLPSAELLIIGDGPEAPIVQQAASDNPSITWRGLLVDELAIARVMKDIHAVFVPGDSGLSIVHAFAYGKPYITMAFHQQHGPEIDYVHDDVNGLLLTGDLERDCERIATLLQDPHRYNAMCRHAFQEAQQLAIENWCARIRSALVFDQDPSTERVTG